MIHPFWVFRYKFIPLEEFNVAHFLVDIFQLSTQSLKSHLFNIGTCTTKTLGENIFPLIDELFVVFTNKRADSFLFSYHNIVVHLISKILDFLQKRIVWRFINYEVFEFWILTDICYHLEPVFKPLLWENQTI
jgi:hypothetical protein